MELEVQQHIGHTLGVVVSESCGQLYRWAFLFCQVTVGRTGLQTGCRRAFFKHIDTRPSVCHSLKALLYIFHEKKLLIILLHLMRLN